MYDHMRHREPFELLSTFRLVKFAKQATGFSIRAIDENEHNELIRTAQGIFDRNDYPLGTMSRNEYKFELLHQGRPVLPFTWADYRGGALKMHSTSNEASALAGDLRRADAILAFFDAGELAVAGGRRNREIGRLVALLTSAISGLNNYIPVGLVVTKSNNKGFSLEPIKDLIDAIKLSDEVQGAVIPTECAKGLSTNVDIPTLFVLHYAISGQIRKMKEQIEAHSRDAAYYRSRSNLFTWIERKLDGLPTYGKLADQEIESMQGKLSECEKMRKPAEGLARFLRHVEAF
jgi:hypothetical protein